MELYIGSVRFFKHLILFLILIIVISLMTVTIVLSAENNVLKEKKEINPDLALDISDYDSGNVKSYAVAAEKFSLSYQELYPDLYMNRSTKVSETTEKTIYLTFDDGPSPNTLVILDTLDRHDIKATFFVIYYNDEASKKIYREIVKRGHTIAVHTASHKYKQIYKSIEAYLNDFDLIFNHIKQVTGVKPNLFRFPGGSINPYNICFYQELIAEMLRRGFTYYDWNVNGGDTASHATCDSIYTNVVEQVKKHDISVVLLHDSSSKDATATALERIIVDLQKSGYNFKKLDGSVIPITFSYD